MYRNSLMIGLATMVMAACGGGGGDDVVNSDPGPVQAGQQQQVKPECPEGYKSFSIGGSVINAARTVISLNQDEAEFTASIERDRIQSLDKICFGVTNAGITDGNQTEVGKTYELLAYSPDGSPLDFKLLTDPILKVTYLRDQLPGDPTDQEIQDNVKIVTDKDNVLTALATKENTLSETGESGAIVAQLESAGKFVVLFAQ